MRGKHSKKTHFGLAQPWQAGGHGGQPFLELRHPVGQHNLQPGMWANNGCGSRFVHWQVPTAWTPEDQKHGRVSRLSCGSWAGPLALGTSTRKRASGSLTAKEDKSATVWSVCRVAQGRGGSTIGGWSRHGDTARAARGEGRHVGWPVPCCTPCPAPCGAPACSRQGTLCPANSNGQGVLRDCIKRLRLLAGCGTRGKVPASIAGAGAQVPASRKGSWAAR